MAAAAAAAAAAEAAMAAAASSRRMPRCGRWRLRSCRTRRLPPRYRLKSLPLLLESLLQLPLLLALLQEKGPQGVDLFG